MSTDPPVGESLQGGRSLSVSPVGSGLDPQTSLEHHFNSDVDSHPQAQHHTLGLNPNQAAPGNILSKLVAGTNITLSKLTNGKVSIAAAGGGGAGGANAGVNYLGSNFTTAAVNGTANYVDFTTLTASDDYSGSSFFVDFTKTLKVQTEGVCTIQFTLIYSLIAGTPPANSNVTINMADSLSIHNSLQDTESFDYIGNGLTHSIVKTVTWTFFNQGTIPNKMTFWFTTDVGSAINARYEIRASLAG